MINMPEVKLGIVAVSRDCFPKTLSESRRKAVYSACTEKGIKIFEVDTIIENERDTLIALDAINKAGINALVIYLGNFGPEAPETMLAQKFKGPSMFVAAAEESANNLIQGRGDAYCGMLNASYNMGLRGIRPYIPEYPVGTANEIADMILDFEKIARVLIGLSNLKIFSFGPRPQDFFSCNAPIKPLYDLGMEIMENSELDLYESFNNHANDSRIQEKVREMEYELGKKSAYSGILPKLAQYELTLADWMDQHLGASQYAVFANKCWPAFQTQFGFVPCYVNSRLASRGIPVACETDIYGAVSEYIITCATGIPATLLDINNTVPQDMFLQSGENTKDYKLNDLFMGFHCGNTSSCHLKSCSLKYQLIMNRLLENAGEPNITRGTLEGTIKPGNITLFRLQSTDRCELKSYIAEGEVLDIEPRSFGGIGVFAVKEMARFYRHVLIAERFPHHAGVAFERAGKILFATMKVLGIDDVFYNLPSSVLYKNENPF